MQSDREAFLSACSVEERGEVSVSYQRIVREVWPLIWSQQELPPLLTDEPAETGQGQANAASGGGGGAYAAGTQGNEEHTHGEAGETG